MPYIDGLEDQLLVNVHHFVVVELGSWIEVHHEVTCSRHLDHNVAVFECTRQVPVGD